MRTIEIGPIENNPQTVFKLIFGAKVKAEKVLASLMQSAKLREAMGWTTHDETSTIIEEATRKLTELKVA